MTCAARVERVVDPGIAEGTADLQSVAPRQWPCPACIPPTGYKCGVHRNPSDFGDTLLQWRSLELAALDAEGDLRRIGEGQYDPRLFELSLLAQQLRSCADAVLRALLDTIDSPRQ